MASLHHLEILVREGRQLAERLANQYSFLIQAVRQNSASSQWLLSSGKAKLLLTQPRYGAFLENSSTSSSLKFQSDKFRFGIDTVFDVAIQVKDVEGIVQRARTLGADIMQEPRKIQDGDGVCETAVIKSCVGNVVHTVVNCCQYSGPFFPGFSNVEKKPPTQPEIVQAIDHVTLVCNQGEVDNVLHWYESVFGFSRFLMNK